MRGVGPEAGSGYTIWQTLLVAAIPLAFFVWLTYRVWF